MRSSILSFTIVSLLLMLSAQAKAGSLISHWNFDDGGGSIASDSVGSNDGTLQGYAAFGAGKIGSGAVNLYGSDWVEIMGSDSATSNLNIAGSDAAATVSAWINSVYIDKVHSGIYSRGDWDFGHSLMVKGDMGSADSRPLWTNAGVDGLGGSLSNYTWYHVAKTYDGTTTCLYIDGELVFSLDGGEGDSVEQNTLIGAESSSDGLRWGFEGQIDDVAVWGEALTSGEMRALYNVGNDMILNYNASNSQDLFDAFRAKGTVVIGDRTWYYSESLSSSATSDGELFGVGDDGDFELIMNATRGFGLSTIEGSSEPIPGDANNDGKVDGSDVTILAGNWQVGVDGNETADWGMGDFNNDGKVDGSDVTILAGNWQAGVTAAAASVPEPSTVILLLTALASLLIVGRR